MSQYQSDKCNACKLSKGTRVHNPDTGQSGTVTRSRSNNSVHILWDGNEETTKHTQGTNLRCSVIEMLKEDPQSEKVWSWPNKEETTMSQRPNEIELQIGTRVYNTVTSRKGVITSKDYEGASLRVRYDEDDSDTTIGSGLFDNLQVIDGEHPIVTRNLEERKPETTSIETYLSSNVTSRRGQRLVEHVGVIKKRQALMDSEMLLLARALFAMALYTSKPTAQVENCEFGVALHDDSGIGALHISFFLKEPEVDEHQPSGITWKEIASPKAVKSIAKDVFQEQTTALETNSPLTRLLFLIFGRVFGVKKKDAKPIRPLPNTSKPEIMGTYSINTHEPEWKVTDEAFPTSLIKLLPTATALVQAELDLMQQSTMDDISYIEAFELEVSEE